MNLERIRELAIETDSKLLMVVIDGLGGLPMRDGKTALEAAATPALDELAAQAECGLHVPVAPGITPGSGPAHLGVFGYDPLRYEVGRGVLSALGIGFDLQPGDVAVRGNFCTVDDSGVVTDRRAGRISTDEGAELCEVLSRISAPGAEVFVKPVKEYRFLLVLRGEGLSGALEDTDPQAAGKKPVAPRARREGADKTIESIRAFVEQARERLQGREPANMVLLRGFSQKPDWPRFPEVFRLRAAAIAGYPMYRGVARLLGMDVLETGSEMSEEVATLEQHWQDYDFFYLHFKPTDSAGEDGDFEKRVSLLETADKQVARAVALEPDVLVVTGDHSTPARMKSHSWHPVPLLIHSRYCRADGAQAFGERACAAGCLGGMLPARHIMPLAMAHARRLEKFGA